MDKKTVKEVILGLALGDALGVPAEFMSRNKLKRKPITEMIGGGAHGQEPGTWSDDTSMTLATMKSISECHCINYDDIMLRFIDWLKKGKYTATGVTFDCGTTVQRAIQEYIKNKDIEKCGRDKVTDNGNGSLMRIAPISLYVIDGLEVKNGVNVELDMNIVNKVRKASGITHAHEISQDACLIYTFLLWFMINIGPRSEQNKSFIHCLNLTLGYLTHYNLIDLSKFNLLEDAKYLCMRATEDEIKSSSYVVDTLEASIWCLANSNSFSEAVIKAVNLGDDSDTVGAVVGSLAAPLFGLDNKGKEWLTVLKKVDYIENLCNTFSETL